LVLLIVLPFAAVVFLGELLIAQKLGVHTLRAHVSASLRLLDAVGVCLLCVVVRARILLLLCSKYNNKMEEGNVR
jgi:hypothetical protein